MIKRGGNGSEDNKELIQEYIYETNRDELVGVSENCSNNDSKIPIKTWIPSIVGITLNYDGTTQMPLLSKGL